MRLAETNNLPNLARRYVHLIEAEDLIRELDWSSSLNGDWSFLMHLHGLGRRRTDKWLAANFDDIGVKSTVDLQAKCRSRSFAVSATLPAWLPHLGLAEFKRPPNGLIRSSG